MIKELLFLISSDEIIVGVSSLYFSLDNCPRTHTRLSEASKFSVFNSPFLSYSHCIFSYISSYDARKFAFPDLMAIRKFNKKGEEYTSKKIKKAIKNNELVLFGSYPFDCAKKMILWNKISEMYEKKAIK